ncbi:MAG: hypothetical protein V4747_16855 [Pseudomonadota bacterium]
MTVSATDGMSVYWLKPLMETFRADHPSVGFVILGSDEDDTLRNYSGVDIARLCGNEPIEVGEELHFLFPEVAHPVCSPDYLDTGIHPSRPWLKAGAAHRGTQRSVGDRRAGLGPPTTCPQHG